MADFTKSLHGHHVVKRPPRQNWYENSLGELVLEESKTPKIRLECVICGLVHQGDDNLVKSVFLYSDCKDTSKYRVRTGGSE